jgi:DNA phosphorothioation-associated putative methyltransferase
LHERSGFFSVSVMSTHGPNILRHKTAIRRPELSLPMKCAMRDGLVSAGTTVFDYGCGRGQDAQFLQAMGIECEGWDPAYFPESPVREADVVNLGYVINVIESPEERLSALRSAWALCRKLLVVSAQVLVAGRGSSQIEFGDGVLTSRSTFQKYFRQEELKSYLEQEVGREAVPADIGIFYLFKDETAGQDFVSKRYRRRAVIPQGQFLLKQFEAHRELLEPFMASMTALGRLPEPDECPNVEGLVSHFGTLKRVYSVVRRATGEERWDEIVKRCTEDLLVYLALGRFQGRPPISVLPVGLQRDIRAFFGSYANACRLADALLFRAGDAKAVDEACRNTKVGKLLPEALYVHRSALESLDPLLRVYEGCGRAYLGDIEGANLIKIHRQSGKLSYLVYADFEADPHPALVRSVKLNLRTRELECLDYSASNNPPVLHRKETFLDTSSPLYDKFAKLTKQEETRGLLDEASSIGTREGWKARLTSMGFAVRGHRLVKVGARPERSEGESDFDEASSASSQSSDGLEA